MIKNISFDLWMTLIKSHPEFKLKRAQLIIDKFNISSSSAKDVDDEVRTLDKLFDRYNELSRKKIPANEMYRRVLDRILGTQMSTDDVLIFRKQVDDLFLEYTPRLLNDNIAGMLNQLASRGYVLNIASNTGFIEGHVLRQSLADLDILKYFSFTVFSDEVNASKPSSHFFQKVYDHIQASKNQVLHIGDNTKTDYQGARSFGFNSMLIIDPQYGIEEVAGYIASLRK